MVHFIGWFLFCFSDGVGRTGIFCLVYTGVQEVNQGNSIPDVPMLAKLLRAKRKHIIRDMDALKFCYHAILYHCQDILMKREFDYFNHL